MQRQPLILNYATRRRIDWQVAIVTAMLPGVMWVLIRAARWMKENGPRRMEITYQIDTNLSEACTEIASGQFTKHRWPWTELAWQPVPIRRSFFPLR